VSSSGNAHCVTDSLERENTHCCYWLLVLLSWQRRDAAGDDVTIRLPTLDMLVIEILCLLLSPGRIAVQSIAYDVAYC